MHQRLSLLLSKLDALPFGPTLAGGTLLGLSLGILALRTGPWGLAAIVVVSALAAALAWTGQPVGVWEEPFEDLLDMVEIEGGTFVMGSPEDEVGRYDDERQHKVTVSSFLISRTTVTKGEYKDLMDLEEAPGPGTDNHPVTEVSWFDAVKLCNQLSEQAGLKPCYRIRGVEVKWIRDTGYRLPTESEWEYAARAGTTTRWSFGDDQSKLGDAAWFGENSEDRAHEVGTRDPNPWGLYDMHGNVCEWCWEVFGQYPFWRRSNPRGRFWSSASSPRVLRGGAFLDEPRRLRSAYRYRNVPEDRYSDLGFRCVRRSGPQP